MLDSMLLLYMLHETVFFWSADSDKTSWWSCRISNGSGGTE